MLLLSLVGLAAALEQPPAAPPPRLETLVVTAVASRVPESQASTPSTVTVIEREELERRLARDLRDALRYEPGLAVETGATRFGLGNVAIRGLEGNRVQMLQDGIRLPDGFRIGSFSNAGRNPFDLGLASKVEILRGPGSALHGSDALAGVISVTTLEPADILSRGRAGGFVEGMFAEADRSSGAMAAAAVRDGPWEALAGASAAAGHERDNRGDIDTTGNARTVPNPQDTRFGAGLVKLAWSGGGHRARFTWDRYVREAQTDVLSLNPQSARTVSLTGDDTASRDRVSLDGDIVAGAAGTLRWLAYHQDSRTTQDTVEERANTTAQCLSASGNVRCRREARFTFEQSEIGASVVGDARLRPARRLVYGAEWARGEAEEMRDGRQTNLNTGAVTNVVGTDIFPTRDFPRSRVDRAGAFAQAELDLRWATLIPALRFDRFSMKPQPDALYVAANPGRTPASLADSAWSPKLGALVPLARGHTLALQYATGFRAPPYFDANIGVSNMPLGYAVIPNPGLEAEKSRGFEAALRYASPLLEYSLLAYRTDYSNLIVSRAPLACPGDPGCVPGAPITFQSQNVGKARIEGLEARFSARIAEGWTARGGAAWARGDDRSKGVPLNSVDPAKVVAGLAWERRDGELGAEAIATHAWAKTRIDTSAGRISASRDYTVVDLVAHARLGARATLRAGIFNATNAKYWNWSDVRGLANLAAGFDRYTQPGRNFSASLRFDF